ncbi:MAG: hypothetical protein CR989_04355 [Flavobacteriales bacterium]|nr:MAG: hypothetical protein CR989_04355 [Flavobacteriales bacterium]
MTPTNRLNTANVRIKKDDVLLQHIHFHRQITHSVEDELALAKDGVACFFKNGMSMVIPSNVKHNAGTINFCKVTDTFCTVRKNYK